MTLTMETWKTFFQKCYRTKKTMAMTMKTVKLSFKKVVKLIRLWQRLWKTQKHYLKSCGTQKDYGNNYGNL